MKKGEIILALALIVFLTGVVAANLAPSIGDLEKEVVVCESTAFSYKFSATDPDGNLLQTDISPKNPFFSRVISSDSQKTEIEIYSSNISKEFSNKVYEETIAVSDGEFVDTKTIIFKIFETNNPPRIKPIGATTVSLDKSSFLVKQVYVEDIESGNERSGNFSFQSMFVNEEGNISINSSGLVQAQFSSDDQGLHAIKICATDNGINLDNTIGFCGKDEVKETSCEDFQLSVVETNGAPTIVYFNSTNQSSKFSGTIPITLDVYKFDPDGIMPDTYWYVDEELKKIDFGESKNTLTYAFGCGVYGRHRIKAEITDGLLNDSIELIFDIGRVNCLPEEIPGEKIGPEVCQEKLACHDWELCQNAASSAEIGYLDKSDLLKIKEICLKNSWSDEVCGFQIKECEDTNSCNANINSTYQIQACLFSLEPTCSDEIKNCHEGKCEFLVDCGGPCKACPTCSDEKENQGEEYIDCGGPCKEQCPEKIITPEEISLKKKTIIAFLILLALAGILIFFILREKRKLEEPSIHGSKEEIK